MKVDTNSEFIKYELSEDEALTSCVLSDLNKANIQNLVADTASDLLNIPLHISDESVEGKNKRAFTQGMLHAYKHLLELNTKAREAILEIEQSQNQNSQGE